MLNPSSNKATVGNLVPGEGSPEKTWIPNDDKKTLQIVLPFVHGIPPQYYQIMEVDISSTGNLGTVILTIVDDNEAIVFNVCMNYYHTQTAY